MSALRFPCKCRNCGRVYEEHKATADWKGYCSQRCLHEKARAHGYSKRLDKFYQRSEYDILRRAGQIGSVPQ